MSRVHQFNGKEEVRVHDITMRCWLDGADQDGSVATNVHLEDIAGQHEECGLRVQEQRWKPLLGGFRSFQVGKRAPRLPADLLYQVQLYHVRTSACCNEGSRIS